MDGFSERTRLDGPLPFINNGQMRFIVSRLLILASSPVFAAIEPPTVEITQRKPSFYVPVPSKPQKKIVSKKEGPKPWAQVIPVTVIQPSRPALRKLKPTTLLKPQAQAESQAVLSFDIPITYNQKVKEWIQFYQSKGRRDLARWLERSQSYLPHIQQVFTELNLPQDLAYLALVESGFSPFAVSSADAVGYWQFIQPTAQRFGLRVNWWLDERRDIVKSTRAAALYLKKLYDIFGSWYLAIAGYNTGENRIKRLVERHQTRNFWKLAEKDGLMRETREYIPKMIATVLIAKAPALYGFRDLAYKKPLDFEYFWAPGGLSLIKLARHLNVNESELITLNPELIQKLIPDDVSGYKIRIPRNSTSRVAKFVRGQQDQF